MMGSEEESMGALGVKTRVSTPGQHARRLKKALGYSLSGLSAAYREEAAFRLEAWALAVALPFAFWVDVEPAARAAMIFSAMMVPMAELANSAIEAVVDRVGAERHELSGRAKDIGSAMVLVSLCSAALVWGVCLWT
jgi:diacylglycerol kinase (ATP)